MDTLTSTSIAIAFLGLVCLMVGYTNRDRDYGPFLMWGGVMGMLAVIVYYILTAAVTRASHRGLGSQSPDGECNGFGKCQPR